MKKIYSILGIFSMLCMLSIGSLSASYTMHDSMQDREINSFNYEQHPEKGPAIHYVTVSLVCRDKVDKEILLYRIEEKDKTVGYVYSRGFINLAETIEIYEQPRHVHYIWSYKDINSNGLFKKTCN